VTRPVDTRTPGTPSRAFTLVDRVSPAAAVLAAAGNQTSGV
jgi:hypothetical protein